VSDALETTIVTGALLSIGESDGLDICRLRAGRAFAIACPVEDSLFMHTSSIGGSREIELTALAVVPSAAPRGRS
jgi:hypothetical protein